MSINLSTEKAGAVAREMVGDDRNQESLARLLCRCYQALEPVPTFRFEQTSDPSSFLVNGTFSVHDFEGDPEIPSDRHHLKWGVYIAGESGWLTGYATREEAAFAGWNEIMASGQ